MARAIFLLAVFGIFAQASWAITITTPCPATAAYQGQSYSLPITVTGAASGPISFTLNSSLPPGLSLNSPGTISGIPTSPGTYRVSVTATDSLNNSATYVCDIVVNPSLTITAACPAPIAVVGMPYTYTATVTGGVGPYSWGWDDDGATINGLTLDYNTGIVTGTPLEVGAQPNIYVFDSQENYYEQTCAIQVSLFKITAGCPALAGTVGVPYSFSISYIGNVTPTFTLATYPLPPGLTLNAATGVISGTPTTPGTYPISVIVGVVGAETQTYNCNIVISPPPLVITTVCPITTIPTMLTATGGYGNYIFSIVGSLPPSLLFSGNTISGQLTGAPGLYSFTLQVNDGNLVTQKPCSLTIPALPLLITSGCPGVAAPQGQPFSFTLSATGAVGNYVWSISPALPAGLTLNGNVISGTPTGPIGTVSFTVTVTSGNTVASIPCSMTIAPPRLVLTSACPGDGTVGVAYGPLTLAASGGLGAGTYTFSVIGTLPPGVTFSSNTVSGIPTAAGHYVFSFSVVSGQQTATSAGCAATILPAGLTISANCPTAPFPVGTPLSISFGVVGGQQPYTFSITGASWLTVTSSGTNYTLSGTPALANIGTVPISLTATDALNATATFKCTLTIVPAPLQLGGSCPANPIGAGAPISVPVTATGGVPPYAWTLGGNSGLSLASPQGASDSVTGNAPTTLGTYNFTLTLADSAKTTPASLSCTLSVQVSALQITGTCPASTLSLPLTLSVPLSGSGGQTPYTWKLTGPSWLGLSSTTGAATAVSNTSAPTASGPFSFSVTLSDNASSTPATFSCNSSINAPPAPTVVVTGLTLQPSLLQSTAAGIQVATAPLLPVTGTVQLSFIPNAFGITDNPQVYFNGGARTATFNIAPGQTSFALPNVQLGTDAGTIHLEVIDLTQGGAEVLSTTHPFAELIITRQAPVIGSTDVSFANETANGFDVVINGYSTPRDMKSVTLTFTATQGATLTGTTSFTVDVSSLFTTFYSSAASQLVGSMFTNLHVPVTTTGDKTAIGSVTVVLTNSIGNSQTITLSR